MVLPAQRDLRVWLALGQELDAAGGEAVPRAICPHIAKYFAEIESHELEQTTRTGENQWLNRVHWVRQRMVDQGLIDGSAFGVWRLTGEGRSWVRANWRGWVGPIPPDTVIVDPPAGPSLLRQRAPKARASPVAGAARPRARDPHRTLQQQLAELLRQWLAGATEPERSSLVEFVRSFPPYEAPRDPVLEEARAQLERLASQPETRERFRAMYLSQGLALDGPPLPRWG